MSFRHGCVPNLVFIIYLVFIFSLATFINTFCVKTFLIDVINNGNGIKYIF
jgi:hypothetical protein